MSAEYHTFAASAEEQQNAAPSCPLCGETSPEIAFRDNRRSLRVCSRCELFFVDPYPNAAQEHTRVSTNCQTEIQLLDCRSRYQGERLYYDRHFASIAEECAGAASILDVGCGMGHLLERFGRCERLHRAGIELNSRAAAFARRVAGCEIFEIPLEQFRSTRQFDVITMINVFSHVPSFDAMFASVRAALRPGGKLILRTSEMAANVSRWNQLHWGIPDDLHFMGLRTLEFICSKYGFSAVRHLRTPFEDELFQRSRWQQVGRSRAVNLAKWVGIRAPGLLGLARKVYSASLGNRLFVSFIVLKPIAERGR